MIFLIVIIILIVLALRYSEKHKYDDVLENGKKRKNPFVIALLIIFGLIAVFAVAFFIFIFSLVSKLSTDDVGRYQEEYSSQGIDRFTFFPTSIPENATNVKFSASSGLQSHERSFELRCTLPADEIEQYMEDYEYMRVSSPDYPYSSPLAQKFVGNKSDSYEAGRYILYSDDKNGGCGFIVDTKENTVMFFFDEFRCVH